MCFITVVNEKMKLENLFMWPNSGGLSLLFETEVEVGPVWWIWPPQFSAFVTEAEQYICLPTLDLIPDTTELFLQGLLKL